MTVFTSVGTEHMIDGLRRRPNTTADRVTGNTVRRRPLEYSADVAGCAVSIQVSSTKAKPSREMIEVRVKYRLGIDSTGNQQQKSEPAPHQNLMSAKDLVVWQRAQSVPNPPE